FSALLALTVVSAGAGAQTPPPSGSAPRAAPVEPPAPPGSVPIEPEGRQPGPPGAAPTPPSPRPPPGKVEFIPNDPSVSLLTQSRATPVAFGVYAYGWWGWGPPYVYRTYAPVYTPICRGRCTASMEPGTYELALEKNGRVVRAAPTNIPGNAKLDGNFVDH